MQSIDDMIRLRETFKVFGDPEQPQPAECDRAEIEELVSLAGWAPFHHEASGGGVPWRFHVVDAAACRVLGAAMAREGDTTKIPKMLAAAVALVQATWMPEGISSPGPKLQFDANLKNMEHIAATAAAVQNLLLAATARGYRTYWSSGGALSEARGMAWLGIPAREILLASVFLFPAEVPSGLETATGKNRNSRGDVDSWMKWVELGSRQ